MGQRSPLSIDVDALVAIDVHTHAMVPSTPPSESRDPDEFEADAQKRWKTDRTSYTVDDTAAFFRERKMAAVIFPVDHEAGLGQKRVSNYEVLEAAKRNSDVLIPFASVDPWKGKMGHAEADDLIRNHGVHGFKFHPSSQAFFPNDRLAYPLFELINDAGLTAVFHSGQTGLGRTLPGGGGVRLKYSNPMFLDDVAVDFPNMNIVIAHPSVPWQSEALAVCLHKQNVFIDLSGWSPKYFPDELVHYSNTLIKHKVMFGTDFPLMTPERWTEDFAKRGFRDEVVEGIMKGNAARMLGLVDP